MSSTTWAPTLHIGHPSSATTARFVFLTDATTASTSSGRTVRRSSTSTSISSFSSARAAASAWCTIFEWHTTVTSDPSRFTSATPIGVTYSSSGTSSRTRLYMISLSMKTTGSLSRIALFRSPFASFAVAGAITFSPGT